MKKWKVNSWRNYPVKHIPEYKDEGELNLVLNITITNEDNSTSDFNLKIDINKPPADDLFYLWGGMTVFWTAIGAYVLYISSKFSKLRDK